MSSIKAWVKDLNIDESQYQDWLATAGDSSKITAWTILSGHLDASKYLHWARDHYGLCSLNDSFFNDEIIPPIWDKVKALPHWSSQLAPIHEWDGTLFVACVEPQPAINWGFSVQYVLASPNQLQNYWMKLNSVAPAKNVQNTSPQEEQQHAVASTPQKPQVAEHPTTDPFAVAPSDEESDGDFAQQLEALNGFDNKNSQESHSEFAVAENTELGEQDLSLLDGQSFEEIPPTPDIQLQTATNIEALQPQEESSAETMEGLNLNLDTPSRNDSEDPAAIFNQDIGHSTEENSPEGLSLETKTNIAHDEDVPEGLNLNISEEVPEGLNLEATTPSSTSVAESENAEHTQIPDGLLNTKTSISAEPEVSESTPVASDAQTDPPQAPQTGYAGEAAPVAQGEESAQSQQDGPSESTIVLENAPIDLGQAKSERDVVAFFFKQLRQEYTKTMALIFKGEDLYPWHWDNSWANVSPETKKTAVDLKAASVFRIVHRTKMPYHGYVVESDVNKEFFKDWGMNELPGCLTLIPLSQSGYLFGMLLCVGEADKNSNFVLSFAEKIAEQFLEKISNSSKAA